jgi:hypothetical protein
LERQPHGDFIFGGGVARAKDAGLAAGTDGGEQQVTSIDKRVFHGELLRKAVIELSRAK